MEINNLCTQKNIVILGLTAVVLTGGSYYYYYRYGKPKGNDKNLVKN